MYLRHILAFIAVAEELHFGRAAKRLHIEQSPLSRRISRLETNLGVLLLRRNGRRVHLTAAGQAFLEDARRVMLACEQAQARARATAAGYQGMLRIGLVGDIGHSRLAALLALCRQEAPEISINLSVVPLQQIVYGLGAGLFDAGLAPIGHVGCELVAVPLWRDPFLVALPARHPLVAYRAVPLEEVARYPLVLCDPQICTGCHQQREHLFRSVGVQPTSAEYVSNHSLMLAKVAAGYGVGLSSAAHLEGRTHADVVARPLAEKEASMTTYLLRPSGDISEPLHHFMDRAERVGSNVK